VRGRRLAGLALCAALLAGGACSSSGKKTTGTTVGSTSSTSSTTSTSTSGAPSTTAALTGGLAVHADGYFPAYLKAADPATRTLVVDEIQFLTGDAAKKAYKADNPTASEDSPPNDYYIKNVNPLLTSVKVAPDAKISVNVIGGEGSDDLTKNRPIDFAKLAGYLRDQPQLATSQPFWITVAGGSGTIVAEQFVP
jgi:hypothetical protein